MNIPDESFLSTNYHDKKWFKPGNWQELLLVGSAVKLGILTTLNAAPMSASKLADELGFDKRTTTVTLDALASMGYLSLSDSIYALTQPSEKLFGDKNSPDYIGWAVLHSWRLAHRWLTLPEVLKSGEPIPGDRFLESVEGFVRAMDVYASPTADEAVEFCLNKLPDARSALDIGGATGTISKLLANRGLNVTLFDRPDVIDAINNEITAGWPLISLVGGDFNESIPDGPFDIVFLGNIAHIYGADKNQILFKRIYDRLAPDGLIAIQDYVRGRSPSAPLFGVNMLVNTYTGGAWTEDEYSDWLTGTGFLAPTIVDLQARDQQLVLAKKQ